MKTLIERAGLFLLLFAFASLLRYYGGLRLEASVLIGGAFTIVALWLYILKTIAMFKPYKLIIGISYDALWEDLKLTPAEGPRFENFTFTAISAAIFARSDEREYSRQLDLYKEVPTGAATWRPDIGNVTNGPTFFFRPMRDGYQFGIHVQEEWWKLHSPQLAPVLRDLPLSYGDDVVLGLLPYGYMPEHTRRWNETISLWYGFDRKQRQWKKRLQEQGFTFSDDYPTHIKHRYLGISYVDI